MNTSYYNGISGIKTQQFGIDVWANNIANVNTKGFKSSTPEFSTQFATTMSDSYFEATMNDVGLGSRVNANELNMSQGSLLTTDNVFDLALNQEGWFGTKSNNNQTLYTRVGEFSVDANGDMVNADGNYLLGTSGKNLAPVTLSEDKMNQFGRYYTKDSTEAIKAYSIKGIGDIPLSSVNAQDKINLPNILYYPPEATTYINYQANLDPKVNIKPTQIDLNNEDILNINKSITNKTISINGSISKTPQVLNAKKDDTVLLTITDSDGKIVEGTARLDDNLKWSLSNKDIKTLDISKPLDISAKLITTQEIPNIEHFETEVISPTGDKNILDMTFTKEVPQGLTDTKWDAKIQLLHYIEDYKVETYDPAKTYDTTIYNIDKTKNQVTKIYDPSKYKIDTNSKKVYEIIDKKVGDAIFSNGGELAQSNMPTISNGGTPLKISIGTPYKELKLSNPASTIKDGMITFSGNASNLKKGDSVNVNFTDSDGFKRSLSGKVKDDGSWSASKAYSVKDPSKPITDIKTYHIVNNGFDGVISETNLKKSRVADKDGKVEGYLKAYGMDSNGNIIANFSNGESSAVAKVAVYHFQNDQGLNAVSSTMFKQSDNSGKAIFYKDKDGNILQSTKILSNKLEGSNVNFATALTELIVMQKAFDASAKSITTSDQMIQKAINMKK